MKIPLLLTLVFSFSLSQSGRAVPANPRWIDPVLRLEFRFVGVLPYRSNQVSAEQVCSALGDSWELPEERLYLEGQSIGNTLISRLFTSPLAPYLTIRLGSQVAEIVWIKKIEPYPIGGVHAFVRPQGAQWIQKHLFRGFSRPALPTVCVMRPF